MRKILSTASWIFLIAVTGNVYALNNMHLDRVLNETETRQRDNDKKPFDIELLFFFSSNCLYCHQLAPILIQEAGKLKTNIRGISVDGGGGITGIPHEVNPELVERFHIITYPTVYLVDKRTNLAHPITFNALSQELLSERLAITLVKLSKEDRNG